MNDEDIKYGGLFKRSGFFNDAGGRPAWNKRFFAFNKWTMMLQFWEGEEERNYKLEGFVRSVPKRSLSLLSSQLIVQPGPVQRSIFGQRFPFIISNGPAFEGRTLYLSAHTAAARDEWIETIKLSLVQLKYRQRVALMQKEMVTDEYDPAFNTLDNQHKIMVDLENRIKEIEQKISRTHFQCKVMHDRNNCLLKKQEQVWDLYKQVDEKLYALTCEDTHPQRRFRFIKPNIVEEMRGQPFGLYKHTTLDFISKKFHRPESMTRVQMWEDAARRFPKMYDRGVEQVRREFHLENQKYYPDFTDDVLVNDVHTPRMKLGKNVSKDVDHQIRQLPDSEETDIVSLKRNNIFDLVKRENLRHNFQLARDCAAYYDEESDHDSETEENRNERILNEVDKDSRNPKLLMETKLYKKDPKKTVKYARKDIAGYEERALYYKVPGKTARF